MIKISKLLILVLTVSCFTGFTSSPQAALVNVAASASGGFGSQGNPGSTAFVLGHTFAESDEMILISASGTINLSSGTRGVSPNGITAPAGTPFAFNISYTPLEESLVEAGSLAIPRPSGDPIENIGALIGAFIPASVAGDSLFSPFDEDIVALGIPSTDLFMIGPEATFSAPGPGVLYLGINEWFASNNSGAFQVTINPVPIPAAIWFLGAGLISLVGLKKKLG